MNKMLKKNNLNVKKIFVITPKKIFRGLIFLLLAVYLLVGFSSLSSVSPEEISLSEALGKIKNSETKDVVVYGDKIELSLADDKMVFAQKEPDASFTEILKNSNIDPVSVGFKVDNQNWMKAAGNIMATLLPLGLTALLFLYIFKQMGRAQNSVFSFGKSKAKLFIKGKQSTRFKDVAGLKEVKEELMEVVDFLKHPEKYRKVKARTPKGALLVGPSGVGKTLLARAVAGEAGVSFFSMAGSEFMEMLVGVGASRVRDLFSTAKKMAPSIIFIDEIDAIGRARGGLGVGGGHDEREQTLNQILVEMDGFETNDRVLVIAATNRGDLLDPALLRPGRFDRRFVLTLPDIEEREEILKLHAKGKPFRRVKWDRMARQTVGFSGADLENMVNEAAILAARGSRTTIGEKQLEEAALKVKLGPEKRRLQSELDKKITAYHEAGHAVVSQALPDADPVSRVSIVSRGMALGFTLIPPKKDRLHETRTHILSQISVLLGGRVAEEMKFNEMTTGAGSDIEQATRLARRMVVDFGMSSLGPINYGPQVDRDGWQGGYFSPEEVSPETKANVDREIKIIIDKAYKRAKAVLQKRSKALDAVAEKLVEKETLDQDEFEKLIKSQAS
jgi:cell division protease FtsH